VSTRNITQSSANQAAVTRILLNASVKIERHIFLGLEVVDYIPFFQFHRVHTISLQFPRQFKRGFDILLLRTLIAPRKQHNNFNTPLRQIHPIARTAIDTRLATLVA
jgi:hypothetical protein